MPTPAPGGPPLASAGPPPPLRKFTLHPPALTGSNSPITAAANHQGVYTVQTLNAVRSALVSARQSAAERIGIRDSNRRNLTERQSNEKRAAEEQAKAKETERKRKREEDERKERERAERVERERLEREREEQAQRKREEEAYQKQMQKEEEEKRLKDERERQEALQRAREAKEKKRQEDETKSAEDRRSRDDAKSTASPAATAKSLSPVPPPAPLIPPAAASPLVPPEDVKMEEVLPTAPASAMPVIASAPVGAAPEIKTEVPTIAVGSSPEPEEDMQVKVPIRHEKHKRKRDQVIDSDASDSDDLPLLHKNRKLEPDGKSASPAPGSNDRRSQSVVLEAPARTVEVANGPPRLTSIERKLKEEKFVKHSIPIKPPAPGTATAFYLPSTSLVPPKPESVPLPPTPKRQAEVSGDFSNAKPGTQIAHHTFHTWVDAYLRPFGEDDLAFLAPKPNDITPYVIPSLGKHYTEVWEEEDSGVPVASTSAYASPLEPPPLTRTKPTDLTEDASGGESVTLGPLSERLVAALAFDEGGVESDGESGAGAENVEQGHNGANGIESKVSTGAEDVQTAQINGIATEKRITLDAVELEERVKRELRFIGLLPEEDVDWSLREDDEVSSALRACQRALHHQTSLNEARKATLTSIVKDRMAYQDYETARDAQERVIENGWLKRQRGDKKKKSKRERERDRGRDRGGAFSGPSGAGAGGAGGPGSGAAGDESGISGSKYVSMALLEAMDKRNRLIGHFKPFFEDDEEQGRFFGLPDKSVYDGLEDALREEEEKEQGLELL